MSEEVYVIIPRLNEIYNWGMTNKNVACVLKSDAPHSLTQLEEWQIDRNALKDAVAIIFHEQAAGDKVDCKHKLLQALEGRVVCFLIHFGDTDMPKYLAPNAIRGDFLKLFSFADFDQYAVFPYTGQTKTHFDWSTKIWDVCNQLYEKSRDTRSDIAGLLRDAWRLAERYFDSQRVYFCMLGALSSLHITLSIAKSKKSIVSVADKDAAIATACESVKENHQAWQHIIGAQMTGESCAEAKFPFDVIEVTTGDEPPSNKCTLQREEAFLGWYTWLSETYTAMVGIGVKDSGVDAR